MYTGDINRVYGKGKGRKWKWERKSSETKVICLLTWTLPISVYWTIWLTVQVLPDTFKAFSADSFDPIMVTSSSRRLTISPSSFEWTSGSLEASETAPLDTILLTIDLARVAQDAVCPSSQL
jgi:hypothetical protein